MKQYSETELKELLIELKPVKDQTGNNLIIDCPHCGERECSISLKKEGHLWGCFRLKNCGERGNLFTLLKKINKLNLIFNQFIESISDLETIDINKLSLNKNFDNKIENQVLELETENKQLPIGWTRTFNDEYLNKRGFKSYDHCFVGRTNMDPIVKKDYVIFAVKENNENKAWVARHTWDKKDIEQYNVNYFLRNGIKNKIKRYRNSQNTKFDSLLYGYDELDQNNPLPVCLVEGIFDKHAIDEKLNLYDDHFINVLATFKCHISDVQIAKLKLKNVNDIILFYDPDVISQIQKNVNRLQFFFNVKIIISNINKDPDELSKDELLQVFENQIYRPSEIKYDFLQLKKIKF